jgi:hypothetical protein
MRDRVAGIAFGSLFAVATSATAEVSFSNDVIPLLGAHCVACHMTGQEAGEIALHPKAAYDALVGVASRETALKRVEPGDPAKSYLYLKLTDAHLAAGGSGEPMPMGSYPLPAEQIELVKQWIVEGAKRN